MKFYNIKDEYINYLKKYDAKVADNKKGKRPYVGVVLEIDGIKYYTPFTSPKEKHRKMKNTKDFRKINQGIYGAINFNNMIPVVEKQNEAGLLIARKKKKKCGLLRFSD